MNAATSVYGYGMTSAAAANGPDRGGVNIPAIKNTAATIAVRIAVQNPSLLVTAFVGVNGRSVEVL